jgi:hypothetical protein
MVNKRVKDNLFDKAVQITEEYLGPAGERFIRRQISTHLQIKPEALDAKNMPKLINWSTIAFALLTNSTEDLESFTQDLKALAPNSN